MIEIKYFDSHGYVNNNIINTPILKFFLKQQNIYQNVWVFDDITFYKLILLFLEQKKNINIQFYDFKCIGFRFKNLIFKNLELKQLEYCFKVDNLFCYSYGAYALYFLLKLMSEKKITPSIISHELQLKLRSSFTGGRNEYFIEPDKTQNLFSIDFNLMYLNCMYSNFLSGELFIHETQTISRPGFYYVRYKSENMLYPVLYYKNILNEQIYFCNGEGEGIYGYEEILLFIQEGGKIIGTKFVISSDIYNTNLLPFVDYISQCNDKKIKKQLANTLYGKLAKKDYYYPIILVNEDGFFLQNATNQIKKGTKGYDFFICEKIDYQMYNKYTDISTAAILTSKARIKLYRLLKELNKTYAVCLVNTDEIIICSPTLPYISKEWDVKINPVTFETFEIKKQLYINKRKLVSNKQTRAFNLIHNMLL